MRDALLTGLRLHTVTTMAPCTARAVITSRDLASARPSPNAGIAESERETEARRAGAKARTLLERLVLDEPGQDRARLGLADVDLLDVERVGVRVDGDCVRVRGRGKGGQRRRGGTGVSFLVRAA